MVSSLDFADDTEANFWMEQIGRYINVFLIYFSTGQASLRLSLFQSISNRILCIEMSRGNI
jgi:hypothetical protein